MINIDFYKLFVELFTFLASEDGTIAVGRHTVNDVFSLTLSQPGCEGK